MVCYSGFWHGKWSAGAAATLTLFALGCGGGGSDSTVTVSGKVTYTRRSLAKDATTGIPTGLNASYDDAQIARGVQVRAIKAEEEDMGDGTTKIAYLIAGTTYTDSDGKYSLSVPKDVNCFIEVLSIAGTASSRATRILSDASTDISAIDSSANPSAEDCTLYSLREGLDGNTSSDPLYATKSSGGATVNFNVTENTRWWITATPMALVGSDNTKSPFPQLESTPTGSRVMGIVDSIYTFRDVYGDPTPGGSLDLFYRPSKTDDPRGSFVDYSDASRYYGSIRANGNDDAWDESIIFSLCARNALYSHTTVTPYPPSAQQLPMDTAGLARRTGLDPAHALIDGMPYGMAASLLQSPYLADTNGSSLVAYRDIRDLAGLAPDSGSGAYSAPAIAALSWDFLLKANKLSSDTPTSWSSIDTESLRRFFTLKVPQDSDSLPTDTASIYKQLLRLQESQGSTDTVDLDAIFTDSVLQASVADFGLTWPRPTLEDSYLLDWGTDPSGNVASLIFNMDSAHFDPLSAAFPNLSRGEIAHARFLLSKDTLYTVTLTAPGLPSGAAVEFKIWDSSGQYQTITLSGPATSLAKDVMLNGDSTSLQYIPVHIRLKTGSLATAIDPVTVAVNLAVKAE